MKFVPREPDHSVNVSPEHPLVDFGWLLATVVLASMVLYLGLGGLASWMAGRMSMDRELRMGEWATGLTREERARPGKDPAEAYLRGRLEALAALRPDMAGPLPLTITAGPPNAFMFPGGMLGVTRGLLEQADTRNGLDFVLAHELGHFYHRHAVKGMGRMLVVASVGMVTGMGAGEEGSPGLLSFAMRAADLGHSRAQEREADLFALDLVAELYGHVGHALDFFARLDAKSENHSGLPAYFSTHPYPWERIRELQDTARELGYALEGPTTGLPAFLKAAGKQPAKTE